jgi:hypothetical protein
MANFNTSAGASGTGSMTLQGPNTNSNQTASLPDATGTVMVSGNMPAFSAYASANQSLSNGTWTKMQLNNKTFDTASCFDQTTNYRYTPNVSGYYQISFSFAPASPTNAVCGVYKNGSIYVVGSQTNNTQISSGSVLIYMNGSTDYLELYGVQYSGGSMNTSASSTNIFMTGFLARAA